MKRRTAKPEGEASGETLTPNEEAIRALIRAEHITTKLPKPILNSESLDYDSYDTARTLRRARKTSDTAHLKQRFTHWVLMVAVAALTALVAIFILYSIKQLVNIKLQWVQDVINKDIGVAPPLFLFWFLNLVLVVPVVIVVVYVEPMIGGVGIPEVVAYLNVINVQRVVSLKTLIGKIVCTIFSVTGGMTLGPEAPIVQAGGIIGAGVSQGKASSFKFDSGLSLFRPFRNDHAKLDFICAGTAAGMAAAFGAPIAGVMLVLEEGASFWDTDLILFTFFCALSAKFVFACFLKGFITDGWGALQQDGFLFFGPYESKYDSYSITPLVFYSLLGVMGGLVGIIFNSTTVRLNRLRIKYINQWKWRRVVEGTLNVSITSLVTYLACQYIGACHEIPKSIEDAERFHNTTAFLEPDSFRRFNCKEGEYNDMATLFFQGMEEATKQMWHNDQDFSKLTLFFFSTFYLLLMCITLGIAIPGGLLIPCFLIGGGYGRFLCQLARDWLPYDTGLDETAAAIIGSVAVLSGYTRLTVALAAIIIESTNEFTYSIPLILAVIIAKWLGDCTTHSIIEEIIEVKSQPFLEWDAPAEFAGTKVEELMHKNVVTFNEVETPQHIKKVLRFCQDPPYKHNGFPVVRQYGKDQGTLRGIISRKQLTHLLRRHKLKEIRPPTIDLVPHINQWPYTVSPQASIVNVFPLFRLMGLRWLVVTDVDNKVVGIITRKELIHQVAHLLHQEHQHHDDGSEHTSLQNFSSLTGGGGGGSSSDRGSGAGASFGTFDRSQGEDTDSSDGGNGSGNAAGSDDDNDNGGGGGAGRLMARGLRMGGQREVAEAKGKEKEKVQSQRTEKRVRIGEAKEMILPPSTTSPSTNVTSPTSPTATRRTQQQQQHQHVTINTAEEDIDSVAKDGRASSPAVPVSLNERARQGQITDHTHDENDNNSTTGTTPHEGSLFDL